MKLQELLELIQDPRAMTPQELQEAVECIEEAIKLEDFAWRSYGEELPEMLIQYEDQ